MISLGSNNTYRVDWEIYPMPNIPDAYPGAIKVWRRAWAPNEQANQHNHIMGFTWVQYPDRGVIHARFQNLWTSSGDRLHLYFSLWDAEGRHAFWQYSSQKAWFSDHDEAITCSIPGFPNPVARLVLLAWAI
eukprot:gnl/Hemi2/15036_TR5080_c0_g2_i1.p1 gnl/Hemi2/15036_TR5080_c0_g2~~gnl/Hemi2/15036_TR5080_c0_g2_i1.p1  ORF type:complete len:132 (-),score=15.95 gnl/Hemi2/15036_TR5080_c0_g2_i1:94-489(-)